MNANDLLQDLLRDLFLDQRGLLRWAWEELGLSHRRCSSRRALAASVAERVVSMGLMDEDLFWGLVTRFPMRAHRIRQARMQLLTRRALVPADEPLLHDAPMEDHDVATVDEDLVSTEDGRDEPALPELELDDLDTEEVYPPQLGGQGAIVARVVRPCERLPDLTGLMQPIFSLG